MTQQLAVAPRRDGVDIGRDRVLVERCQKGDASAFDDLYLRYFDRLCRYCFRKLGNVVEAEDCAQEAFARAWRAMANFDGERRFYPWLCVIASHLCVDVVRRNTRSTPVEDSVLDLAVRPVDGGQEEYVERRDDHRLLAEAMDRISPRYREVLQLREANEWSYQRIADHKGVQVSTIETLLFRARKSLRRQFLLLAEGQAGLAGFLLAIRNLFGWRRARAIKTALHAARTVPAGTGSAGTSGAVAGAGGASTGAVGGSAVGAGVTAVSGAGLGMVPAAAGLMATALAAGAIVMAAALVPHPALSAAPARAGAGTNEVSAKFLLPTASPRVARPPSSKPARTEAGRAPGRKSSDPVAHRTTTSSPSTPTVSGLPARPVLAAAGATAKSSGHKLVPSLPRVPVVPPSVGGGKGILSDPVKAVHTTVAVVVKTVRKVLKSVTKVLPIDNPLAGLLGGLSPTGSTGIAGTGL